jgi:AraC family transcriptional activator of pobA
MKEIKRFNNSGLSEFFGLGTDSDSFIFKSPDNVQFSYPEPHRKEMYSLGIITNGTAELRVGLNNYLVRSPGLIAIGPDEVRQWTLNQPDIKVTGLFFTEDFAISGLTDALFLKRLPFYQKTGHHVIPLAPKELSALKSLFQQIGKKHQSNDPNKMGSIQAILRVLLLEAINLQGISDPLDPGNHSQAHHVTARFKELLAERFAIHRSVSYYAEQLFITPKHLSQTIKEQTGKTAGKMIDELVCLEAKILLQIEELNISQVSQQLNFANPSFFSKFFRRSTGLSPQQYRHSLVQK